MRTVKAMLSGVLAGAALVAIVPASYADMAAAKGDYTTYCAKCHGDTGKGDGSGAATLATKPRDFTDCARMATESDDMLFNVIKEGGPAAKLNKAMTGFSDAFEDNEIKGLVAYVRSLCGK